MEVNFKLITKSGTCIFEYRCVFVVCGVRYMITSGEAQPGGGESEQPRCFDSNRKENTQTSGAFGDMFWASDRNGMLKGEGQDDLMHGGNGELTETSQDLHPEDAEDTPYALDIGGEAKAAGSNPPTANGSRDDQMAAIRQILSDVNEEADTEPKAEAEARPAPAAPRAPMRRRDDDDDRDQLESQIDDLTKALRAAMGLPPSGYDAAGLRRSHEKRANKLQHAEERRKKNGVFLTGFTLVSAVTVTMIGLYVLHPQIIAASPEMAPAINEYVVTVDRYRAEANERTAEWRGWLVERIGKLTGKEE
jgi:hypothetical protein